MIRPLSCLALFIIACAANPSGETAASTEPPAEIFPPLPDSVLGKAGWTKVRRVNRPLDCGGIDAIGCFEYDTRRMRIIRELSPRDAWFVLYHETYHMWLGDAKLTHVGTPAQQDTVADAIAAARNMERLIVRRCP